MTTEVTTNTTTNSHQESKQQQQLDKNNNDNLIVDNQLDTPKVEIGKYPLENNWSFWFYRNDKNKEWKDNLVYITSVEFVEDFWAVYNHLQPVNKLQPGSDYMFFKKGINPMWEDKENLDGGRWIININVPKNNRQQLDGYWLNTLLALIGDQFIDDSPFVNGAVMSVRAKGDKISLWTKHAIDMDLQKRIGRKLQEFLSLRDDLLTFEPHQKETEKKA